jgi:hypothetical protein
MIRSILRRIEALEKNYPQPSAGERANKRVAAYLRSHGWGNVVKNLPPAEMDNQQIVAFMYSRGLGLHLLGLVPEEDIDEDILEQIKDEARF